MNDKLTIPAWDDSTDATIDLSTIRVPGGADKLKMIRCAGDKVRLHFGTAPTTTAQKNKGMPLAAATGSDPDLGEALPLDRLSGASGNIWITADTASAVFIMSDD